jgi:hypothetical protein
MSKKERKKKKKEGAEESQNSSVYLAIFAKTRQFYQSLALGKEIKSSKIVK